MGGICDLESHQCPEQHSLTADMPNPMMEIGNSEAIEVAVEERSCRKQLTGR